MKNLFVLLVLMLINNVPVVYGQILSESQGAKLLSETPQEKIFVHYNASLLFSGEYLYYKIYNLNSETNLLSEISTVAYVELVGEQGEKIFKHKVLLKNGLGQSDFFIPTSVSSGNYKLLAYTKWMKNGSKQNFFQDDLAIINPYRGDQSAIKPDQDRASIGSITSDLTVTNVEQENVLPKKKNENVELILNDDAFGKREQVIARLQGLKASSADGNYSLSVKKADTVSVPGRYNSDNFSSLYQNLERGGDSRELVYLPELRGNLISGKIEARDSNEEQSLVNKKIAVSVPGKDFVFKIATTNEKGKFYFNLKEEFPQTKALFQIIGDSKEDFQIRLNPEPAIEITSLTFNEFYITPSMKEMILQRSVYNQIENAYYSVKPDTIGTAAKTDLFYEQEPQLYNLDDYTRFPTISETFIEIIRSSWITKSKDGAPVFEVRGYERATNFGLPPLLLIDGVMVQDHSLFIEYPAEKVKSIGILRDNFYVGSHIFEGIIVVETIEGDYETTLSQNYIENIDLKKPQPRKRYVQQTYHEAKKSDERIPDFRHQLIWKPDVEMRTEEEFEVSFFTSDVTGIFEINVEGFTETGKPVSIKEYFRVD